MHQGPRCVCPWGGRAAGLTRVQQLPAPSCMGCSCTVGAELDWQQGLPDKGLCRGHPQATAGARRSFQKGTCGRLEGGGELLLAGGAGARDGGWGTTRLSPIMLSPAPPQIKFSTKSFGYEASLVAALAITNNSATLTVADISDVIAGRPVRHTDGMFIDAGGGPLMCPACCSGDILQGDDVANMASLSAAAAAAATITGKNNIITTTTTTNNNNNNNLRI